MQFRLRSLFLLSVALFMGSGHVDAQDTVRTAEPPIVEVELSGIEPLPTDVVSIMDFGGGAGGGEPPSENPPIPYWDNAPTIVYPQVPGNAISNEYSSIFVACGYVDGEYPEVEVTKPSGEISTVSTVGYGDCWEYHQTWIYGMELGEYQIIAEDRRGTLIHSWEVEYPPFPLVGLISDTSTSDSSENARVQTRLLMGFEPGEKLTLRIYSPQIRRGESIEIYPGPILGGEGSYVATRIVEADENGTIILNFHSTPSAPFEAAWIGFKIDGYIGPTSGGGLPSPAVRDYELERSNQPEMAFFTQRPDFDQLSQLDSIWQGLNFNDMKTPGTANYQVALGDDDYRLVFTWCADTPERLQEILEPLDLTININETPVTAWDMIRYDEGACREWQSILNANVPELQIEFHYHLSEEIFDGFSSYAAGDYYHIINATFN